MSDVAVVTRATLAAAILEGSKERSRRNADSRFEWYGSANELADAILSVLPERVQSESLDGVIREARGQLGLGMDDSDVAALAGFLVSRFSGRTA